MGFGYIAPPSLQVSAEVCYTSVIHHCVFTIAMVVLLLIFIYLLMYLFIYVKKEFIVHTVIYQLSPLKTEFKSIQF